MASVSEIKKRVKQYGVQGAGQASEPYSTKNTNTSNSGKNDEQNKYIGSDSYQRIKEKVKNGGFSIELDQSYIDSFINDAKKFISTSQSDLENINWGNASSAYKLSQDTYSDLYKRGEYLRTWLNANKSKLDEETYKTFSDTLTSISEGTSTILDGYKQTKDFYSQFGSEEEYNKWYEEEQAKQAILGAEDFEEFKQKGTEIANPTWEETGATTIFGWKPFGEGEKVNNIVTFAEAYKDKAISASANALLGGGGSAFEYTELVNLINEHMYDEEKSIYNYYLGKGEIEKASEYMTKMEDVLKQRQAGRMAEQMDGNALELVFSAVAGLDQFASGIKNLDNLIKGTEGDSTSSIQYAQQIMSSNNEGIWKVANDLVNTTGNMLPSIGVGILTGGIGGTLTMGASASGNAYSEMRSLGYNDWQSRGYAALVGASETLLQSVLGGIGSLGGKYSATAAIGNFTSKLNNALAKTAIKLGGNMISEGIEEGLQTALEPAFKALMTGEKFESAKWDDILYSALLGSLSAGAIDGASAGINAIGSIPSNIEAKKVYGESQQDLVTEALEIDADNTFASKMQSKIDKGKNLSGRQLNRLVNANESALRSQDVDEIEASIDERLTQLGEKGDISKLVKALTKQATGGRLSLLDRAILSKSQYGKQVSKDLNPKYISRGETSVDNWAEKIGTERINANYYSRGLNDYAEANEVDFKGKQPIAVEPPEEDKNPIKEANTASESGKTTQISTGEEISIKEIASIKDGKVILRLDNGETVEASDVEFSSKEEGLLYENIVQMGLNAETANAFIRGFDASEGLSVGEYSLGFSEAYRYGRYSFPTQEMSKDGFSAKLSEAKKSLAYNLGKTDAKYKVSQDQKAVESKTKSYKKYKGETHISEFDKKGFPDTLTESQRNDVKAMAALHDALGINVYFFESPTDESGKRLGKNGYYNPEDGSIHIDLFAGTKGQNTILFTASHELTHFIKDWSPVKFKTFADFLLKKYGMKGISVKELVQKKMEFLKEKGRITPNMTEAEAYDLAYEEVVADSCEAMLADGDIISKIAELKATDRSLWQKIKDFLTNLVSKIRGYYRRLEPDSVEGKYVSEMLKTAEQLKTLWSEALMDASDSYSKAETVLTENGIAVDSKTESASLMSVRDVLDDKQREKVSKALATRFGVTQQEAKAWLNAETSMASLILNPKYSQYLDYTADANEEAIKSNSDYPQGTVDFSNICKKRRDFTEIMNRILRNFPNHIFEPTDLAKIRTIMEQEGMEVACAICYVEDRRQLDSVVAQDFINSLALYREGSKTRPDGKPFNANQLKAFNLIEGDTYTPSIYELISLEGRNALKAKNPKMEEAWVKFNNARGMQSVRLLLNDAEYKRQILKYNKNTVKSKNDNGGLRIYSFSDMEMFHLIDIIQVITDSATVGLSIQGYTKVNEYAKAVKDTGEKLNRSLIPKGDLGYHMEDGKVVLDFDTVEGIDINHPDFFDSTDNPNVGNIVIGINPTQIRAAMMSKFIDYIIPFHTGQSKEVLGEKGIAEWVNYKDSQTEKDIATGKTSKHQINIYTEVIQAAEKAGKPITNKVEFVNKFLEVCKENDLVPRFAEFLNMDENGDYVYTEGYHKFLVDFKTFDTNTGEYLPQMPVKPIFDGNYLTKLLKDYVKSQKVKDAEFAEKSPKVLDRITNEIIKPKSDTKYSDRDSWNNIETIQGLESYSVDEVIDITKSHIQSVLEEYGEYAEIVAVRPLGSRAKGTAKADSDLDIVIQYEGDIREDDMFNMLNDEDSKLYIEGIEVDINPIRADESGDIEDYLGRVYDFDKYNPKYSDRDSNGNTLTPEQADFFKDSKVRDKKGNLKVVYHGTKAKFNVFTKGDIGFHFGTKGAARGRVGTGKDVTIKEVYLNITNPIVFDEDLGSWDADYRLTQELFERGILTKGEAEQVLLSDDKTYRRPTEKANKKLREMLLQKGYNGIEYRNTFESKKDSTSYIVFNSNQAKEITNSKPTSNADIRYSDRDITNENQAKKMSEEEKKAGEKFADFIDSVSQMLDQSKISKRKIKVGELSDVHRKTIEDIMQTINPNFSAEGYELWIDGTGAEHINDRHGENGKQDSTMASREDRELIPWVVNSPDGGEFIRDESGKLTLSNRFFNADGSKAPQIRLHKMVDGETMYVSECVPDSKNKRIYITSAYKKSSTNQLLNIDSMESPQLTPEATFDSGATDDIIAQYPNSVKREFSDADTKYSIREDEPPKKTIKGYKVFFVKNGKLYPPMVANPNGEGTPIGVWLDADDGQLAYNKDGSVMTNSFGRPRVKAGGKGTQGGSGDLAYRPGWHLGDVPMAKQFARKDADGNKTLFPEAFVWAECDVAADVEYQEEADAMGYKFSKNGKFNHQQASLDHMPREADGTAGFYRYRTNPDPTTEAWIITGAMKVNRLLTDAEVTSILKENGREPMPRQGGELDLKKLGLTEADFDARYSDRDTDGVSNRSLLANALESVAQNDIERRRLKEYKGKIALIESEQAKLSQIRAEIKELSFAKGKRDTAKIRSLQDDATRIANRINTYDRQLLSLEASKPLQGVLEREKQMAYKRAEQRGKEALEKYKEKATATQRELMTRYQESRKNATERRHQTEMRHKIKKVVDELNQYLSKGTKDKHVPIELQKPVAEALNAVNMDTVGAEERIAKLNEELLRARTPEKIQEIAKKIEHIKEMGGSIEAKLSRFKTAYDSIINSDDPLVANSYDEVISNTIDRVMEIVGDTPLRNMSLYQLEAVYDMYRMVLHSVRNANKAFKTKKSEEISVIANRVIEEIDKLGKKKSLRTSAGLKVSEFDWNNQKPVYAFERIGSDTFTEVFNNVRAGEDIWAVDMTEAQNFREEQYKKYKYKSWDFKKRYKFTSTSGMQFALSLDQIMSLYAYSKRGDQAKDHLKYGGFVFDGLTEVKQKNKAGIKVTYQLKDATAYNLSEETLNDIIKVLDDVPGAKAFVDTMQDYLSTTMGEKGNEVSLEMYGVKLFKEKNYFPLKSAPQYLERAREQAEQTAKIKNKGFTKETTPKAKNPIVLTSFMDVWANHVNEMSMYHAFTLALEDFYRVFNYKTSASETMAEEGVIPFIENAHGGAAVSYIDQLLKDLNGGARSDPRESVAKALISRFKKTAVMGSLSVVVQQPTAIMRAMALVDAKHFGIAPITRGVIRTFNRKRHKSLWAEVKKYAPVAIIKEMGNFDTGMGKGSVEWLKGEKTFMDKVDDVLSKAPAVADELAWISIWIAVKNEVKATTKLQVGSEAFLKKVGERFTEVIVKTQVYDSTLSKSSNMRSKSTFMNMWTAFMAEPTTSLNMVQDALLKGRRGNKRYAAKAIGAVFGSVLLNSALVSLVYAMRDDDEDETFTEKYLSRATTELLDGINPITYIPFFKDVWSIMQGFDIERADMSLVTDLIDSLQSTVKVINKDTSDMTDEELDEHQKQTSEALWSIVDNIASLTGVPEKNIRRDVKGIVNLFKTIGADATERDTTFGSLMDKIGDDMKASTPIWGWLPKESNADKLYDAIMEGDTAYVDRLKKGFKSESSYESALRKALRDNDDRIKEAAQALYDGNVSEYTRIINEIVDEGKFGTSTVKGAISSEVDKLKEANEISEETSSEDATEKIESIYDAEHYYTSLINGDTYTAEAVMEDLINTAVANGKSQEDAEQSVLSSFRSYLREGYADGTHTRDEAMDMLTEYGGMDSDDAYWEMNKWDYYVENGSYDGYSKYNSFYEAVRTGSNLKSVISEYTSHGVEKKTLASQITSYYKPLYINMTNFERAGIKGYLLNAYVQLGYNRYEKSKDIDKWLE